MKKVSFYLLTSVFLLNFLSSCDPITDDPILDGNTIEITENITVNTVFTSDKVYYINDLISVTNNATLTIEPGTTIKFGVYGALLTGYYESATLLANGTAEKPIVFTSAEANPHAGDWNYIAFGPNASSASILNYCIVEYAGKDEYYSTITIDECKISITNTILRHNEGLYTVYVNAEDVLDGFVKFSTNTMQDNTGHAVKIACTNAAKLDADNQIQCEANKGILIEGDFTLETVTLNKLTVPYIVDNLGAVSVDGTLILMPGVRMLFTGDNHLELYRANSKLVAQGTATDPIIFSSSMPVPEPGAWTGIVIDEEASSSSILDYCQVLYAGRNDYYEGAITINSNQAKVSNCTLGYSERYGIFLMNEASLSSGSTGNTFIDNAYGDTGDNQ